MNRRRFCKAAAAGIMLTASGEPLLAAWSAPREAKRIAAVLYDERYADTREFASVLQRSGAAGFPIRRSAALAWYYELAMVLAQGGGMIAGMSTDADRLIAQSCGRELGFLAVVAGVHDARGADRIAHRLRMRGDPRYLEMSISGADFNSGRLAEVMARSDCGGEHDWIRTRGVSPRSEDHPGYLTSWLLAPRSA